MRMILIMSMLLLCSYVDATSCGDVALEELPKFPSNDLPNNNYPTQILEIVQDHWSATAKMERPTYESQTQQVNCPHLGSDILDWHDANTWSSKRVPMAGESISIPEGKKVMISSCSLNSSSVYGTITIPQSSQLIFDGTGTIELRTTGFKVFGKLTLGSETCRLRNKIIITLHGERTKQPLPADMWVKGIYVSAPSGEIQVHGVHYFPTWTRLARTANVSDSIIFVQDLVNWEVGQDIVITTTELKDSRDYNRNEVRKILQIYKASRYGKNISAIRVDKPLSFKHYGGKEYQAEVGLLSRRIMIQGDEENSEPKGYDDPTKTTCYTEGTGSSYPCQSLELNQGFGGHVQIVGSGSVGKFSGVEFYRMGQTNVMGRYPVHWHFVGNAKTSFIQDSSIHRTFFRCVTLHATNDVRVSQNVAFDAIGHCYYLEDAVEERNVLEYNLGAYVHFLGPAHKTSEGDFGNFYSQRAPTLDENENLALPADISASPFYISNPHNTFIGNAASGGWSGFAFPNIPDALKLSKAVEITPMNRPLIKFKGNTAHSTSYWWSEGGAIYVGGWLKNLPDGKLRYTFGREEARRTCKVEIKDEKIGGWCPEASSVFADDVDQRSWMVFEDNKVFLSNGAGINHWGDRVEVVRHESIDCSMGAKLFGEVASKDLHITCRSNHSPEKFQGCIVSKRGVRESCNVRDYYWWTDFNGYLLYDTFQTHIIADAKFTSCSNLWSSCLRDSCKESGPWFILAFGNRFVPQVMRTMKGIQYDGNNNPNQLWVFSGGSSYENTLSRRLVGWVDEDGSSAQVVPKQRHILGSYHAGDWWKIHDQCTIKNGMYICSVGPTDELASIRLDHPKFATFDYETANGYCENDYETTECPVIAKVSHFGREDGMDVIAYSQITGPSINENFGWFLNFDVADGTPKTLVINNIQMKREVMLLVAIPYPSGSTFEVIARTPKYACWERNLCVSKFLPVTSIDAVRFSKGNVYFYDNQNELLYMRLIQTYSGSLGYPNVWQQTYELPFERYGMSMPVYSWEYSVTITAKNCGGGASEYCSKRSSKNVPQPLGEQQPTLSPTKKPTKAPTLSPTKRPTTEKPTMPPIVSFCSSIRSSPACKLSGLCRYNRRSRKCLPL